MRAYHSILSFLIWSALMLAAPAYGQVENQLWYKTPARQWTEALPVGNGRLGAMVFGDVRRERIQLNEESLWAGNKIDNNNPRAAEYLPEVRKAIFEGEYKKAWDLSDQYLLGTPPRIRSFQTLGDVFIHYHWSDSATAYKRSLALDKGVARTEYRVGGISFVQEVFASAPHNVIVIRLTADQDFSVDVALNRERDVSRYDQRDGTAWYEGQVRDEESALEGPGGDHMRFCTAMRVLSSDGKTSPVSDPGSSGFRISDARNVTLILTAATDYDFEKLDTNPKKNPLEVCEEILAKASKYKPEALRSVHEQDHANLFSRVKFRLGAGEDALLPTDERLASVKSGKQDRGLIALYFQYGRYLLMASSRKPGKLPANLQGIWNDLYVAKWNSDFHTNINLQMNYWAAETGNLSETTEPLSAFVKKLTGPGAVTARKMYGANGWTLHHLTDVYGRTGVADGVWGLSPMAGPWMTFPLFRHYEFTLDKKYLKETAYPVMRGSVLFVLDFLVESPEGYLVTNPSHSPENPFYIPGSNRTEKTYLCYAATIDTQIIQALFLNFLKAATILKTDDDLIEKVNGAMKRLPPMEVAENGALKEWMQEYEEVEPGHRHISHLLGLYPLSLINPGDTLLFNAARKTIERRMAYSTRHVGWSSAWVINFYARLYDAEKAGEQVNTLLQHSTLGNLFNTIPPFQIDGNMGGAAGIAEMLLQSHNEELHILPALPSSWDEGSISGLKARGNYEVDFSWSQGKLSSLTVYSSVKRTCRMRYRDRVREVGLKKGKNMVSIEKFLR